MARTLAALAESPGRTTTCGSRLPGDRTHQDTSLPGKPRLTRHLRWPDGHRSVLKWRPGSRATAMRAGPLAVVEALRLADYPAPATELVAQVDDAVVTVQELLPGTKVDRLDQHGLDQALALNQAQAGRLADRPDIPAVALHLRADGPGYCLHEPLRRHNRRAAALEGWVAAVGADCPTLLEGPDAVHQDFHPGNLLAAEGSITGVIDWDGAARGDHRFDLVTLRFGVQGKDMDPAVARRLDAILDTLPDEVLRPAWAHMSLRMVDWAIRHFTPADVESWPDLAEQRVR
ncbi:aminoglycoside phosphotransferase family protein [Streptomyces profundus]|nr:aminoglycoside phosphotransferase family protein [Streptomyces sp. MA3_2.13]